MSRASRRYFARSKTSVEILSTNSIVVVIVIVIVIVIVLAISAMGTVLGSLRSLEPKGDVVVVRGPNAPFTSTLTVSRQAPWRSSIDRGVPASVADLAALTRELSSHFPTLGNMKLACTEICTLTAITSEARDKTVSGAQLPYLGNLEDLLRHRGLKLVGNLMIEETGGGENMLRLRFVQP